MVQGVLLLINLSWDGIGMANDRKKYAAKNALAATLGNVLNSLLALVSRTIFIYSLGTIYNGINGLYSNVLGMLSLAELGVGAAISFTLYKPLAEKDIKKIQAIMNFYRIAYRLIVGIILAIGIALVPFLKHIIKGANGVDHLILYYLIYLFNTVSSYLLIYKSTLVEADQKSYLITNINTITKVLISVSQIIVLLLFRNFLIYLVMGLVVQLFGNIYINYFCNKEYPYLKEKNEEKLSTDERNIILTKIRALMAHKIGDKAVNQTDNIIISYFINVTTVGLVTNYTMIINLINTFIIAFFNSATAAIGNIIATEENEKKIVVVRRYDFLGYVFYGWSFLCLYFMLTPFISFWIGKDKLINKEICFMLCANYFLTGIRVPFSNVKGAAGMYEQDKMVPLLQAAVNLLISIYCAKYYGLIGIYIGTLTSSLVPLLIRPVIVYKYIFKENVKIYFEELAYRLMQIAIAVISLSYIFDRIIISNIIAILFIRLIVCTIMMTVMIIIFYRKHDELLYIKNILGRYIKIVIDKRRWFRGG